MGCLFDVRIGTLKKSYRIENCGQLSVTKVSGIPWRVNCNLHRFLSFALVVFFRCFASIKLDSFVRIVRKGLHLDLPVVAREFRGVVMHGSFAFSFEHVIQLDTTSSI